MKDFSAISEFIRLENNVEENVTFSLQNTKAAQPESGYKIIFCVPGRSDVDFGGNDTYIDQKNIYIRNWENKNNGEIISSLSKLFEDGESLSKESWAQAISFIKTKNSGSLENYRSEIRSAQNTIDSKKRLIESLEEKQARAQAVINREERDLNAMYSDLENLISAGKYKSIDFNESGVIAAQTTPISIDYGGDIFEFGSYFLWISFSAHYNSIKCFASGHRHPYISSDERTLSFKNRNYTNMRQVCLGQGRSLIANSFKDGDFSSVLLKIHELLSRYNPNDETYCSIHNCF